MNVRVFEVNYAKATYEPEKKRLTLVWDGSPSEEQYKVPSHAMLSFARTHAIDNSISDISKQGMINPNSRKWFEKGIMPQAIAPGMHRAAIVTSGNVFKLYYVNLMLVAVNKFSLRVQLLKDQEEASQPVSSLRFLPSHSSCSLTPPYSQPSRRHFLQNPPRPAEFAE